MTNWNRHHYATLNNLGKGVALVRRKKLTNAKSDLESLVSRAHLQWEARRFRSAFRLLLAAAKLGDRTSQLNLGYFYDVGLGVQPNRKGAMKWYLQAYRQGIASAASNIGIILREEGSSRRALAWFGRAVKLGNVGANLEIAKLYLQVPKHVYKAVPHLERVRRARPRIDVTESNWEEAERLLASLQG